MSCREKLTDKEREARIKIKVATEKILTFNAAMKEIQNRKVLLLAEEEAIRSVTDDLVRELDLLQSGVL
jgi:hypothetical protein